MLLNEVVWPGPPEVRTLTGKMLRIAFKTKELEDVDKVPHILFAATCFVAGYMARMRVEQGLETW